MNKGLKVFIYCIDGLTWIMIKINTVIFSAWVKLGKFNEKMGFKK